MITYLDNSATTKIREEALQAYVELSKTVFGNPSSLHKLGFEAEKVIKGAKETILKTLGENDSEVVFCASGSEANNLAIIGRAFSKERYKRGAKIITTEGEHASVSAPVEMLRSLGYKIAAIPTKNGKIDTDALLRELTPDVILVSIMMVNNETGALYDVGHVSRIMKRTVPEALLHVDATQSYLKIPFTKKSLGADMITLSSHKIEGPKGVGALVIGSDVLKKRGIAPLVFGGGQGLGLRAGTENVPGIGAFSVAARLGFEELRETYAALSTLRDYFIRRLDEAALPGVSLTLPEAAAPHILNVTVGGIKSETLLHFLSSKGIYVSSGSACSSNSHKSHSAALLAYGKSAEEADSSIRISISKANTEEDAERFISALREGISSLARTSL